MKVMHEEQEALGGEKKRMAGPVGILCTFAVL
jgi:hypothetical protein